jgi:hypothetical protein
MQYPTEGHRVDALERLMEKISRDVRSTGTTRVLRKMPFLERLRLGLANFPRAFALWQEFCSFVSRTEKRWLEDNLAVDKGPHWEKFSDGSFQICMRRRPRISDIEKAFQNRDWGTILDHELFLEGWAAGAVFAARIADSDSASTNSSKSSQSPRAMTSSSVHASCDTDTVYNFVSPSFPVNSAKVIRLPAT